ncbi:pyridoxal-phosphate dependent enzyme [Granulicoccus sp. GXG6511]|uniref:pyridoxal-phosphate dependent enzyme n=1 Tax=Granulicoccus sp. GXG6511 TaxID=3381351 RepID=UPI003D7DA734
MTSCYAAPKARRWLAEPPSEGARGFHRALPGYRPTPLRPAPGLAAELGVGRVLVKDESERLGLPAFKILGASWACHHVLQRNPGATLVTATEGNHGRAIARMAGHFGVPARIFVPRTMRADTAALIAAEGAEIVRVDGDYDAAVAAAAGFAAADGSRELVQDTAWEGYAEVPARIVAGYRTLLLEIDEELGRAPDLVVVPVGVGSLAEAVVRHYRQPATEHPTVLLVEPDTAACVLTSLVAGSPTSVTTASTVMAGLNCATVSATAWPVLRDGCDAAVAVADAQVLDAVDELAAEGIAAGPCGAATLAGVRAFLADPERRVAAHLAGDAVVVLINTEGPSPT